MKIERPTWYIIDGNLFSPDGAVSIVVDRKDILSIIDKPAQVHNSKLFAVATKASSAKLEAGGRTLVLTIEGKKIKTTERFSLRFQVPQTSLRL